MNSPTKADPAAFGPYPFPDRDPNPQDDETGSVEIGWDSGTFEDGRPYLAECWADGMTVLTFFFSRRGLEECTEAELADLLEAEGIIRWTSGEKRVSARSVKDRAGTDVWSVSVVVGLNGEPPLVEDTLRLKSYPRN